MRHIKTLQRIACTLALVLVAVLAVSAPKLAFADSIDTSTPGVKVSVFSADGNADTSRVLTDNLSILATRPLFLVSMARLSFALVRPLEILVRIPTTPPLVLVLLLLA